MFAGLDAAGRWLEPPPLQPFECVTRADGGGFILLFDGAPIELVGRDGVGRPLPCRGPSAAAALNELFQVVDPPLLGIVPAPAGGVSVRQGETVLVEIPAVPSPVAATDRAAGWAREVDRLLAGKGRRTEVCPSCHLDRPRDMQVARRDGLRR